MDTKITPLPWARSKTFGQLNCQDDKYMLRDADAAFIVKAVNMHGQLVAALDMLLDDIEEHRGIAYTTFDAEDMARGILAEAEGK